MNKLGPVVYGLVITLLVAIPLSGYMYMKLWQWFIVYAFNVKPITFIQAIGLAYFVRFAIKPMPTTKDKESDTTYLTATKRIIKQSLFCLVLIGIAWGITLFQ